jgi:retinol dehydrogenase-14
MISKICMVTGASSGIGKAIALSLAAMGAKVVAVCRDRERGQIALHDILAVSPNHVGELMIADLSSQASIHQLVSDYRQSHDQLHVLINNAGVNRSTFTKTVDGIETTFAVNHLAPFLLTHLLLDVLKASAPARVVNIMGWEGTESLHFDDLMSEEQYSGLKAYQRSKLACALSTSEFAKRLINTGVTVNAADPGFVRTNLGREAKGFFKIFLTLVRPFMVNPEKGAETPVYVATDPTLEDTTGQYFANKKEKRFLNDSYDETTAQKLWQISAELTQLHL